MKNNIDEDVMKLPDDIMMIDGKNPELLIFMVFNDIENKFSKDENNNYINYIKDRAILRTKNKDVNDINK